MDQGAIWHEGRPQPRQLCVRWGPRHLPTKRVKPPPQFLAHFNCDQTAGLIKMPLATKVGLGPGHIVLHGYPALPPKRVTASPIFGPCLLWPNGRPSQLLLSTFCTAFRRVSLYFTMGRPFPPQNCPFPWGIRTPISNNPSPQPKRHLDRFSRFAGLTSVTDRQTDRPTDRQTTLLDWLVA